MKWSSFRWGTWLCMTMLVAGNGVRGGDGKGEAAVKHPPPEPWQVAGIRSALGDPSAQVRAEAAFYCGASHWSRQCLKMEDLLPLLQDADRRVKITALEGLTDMGPELTPAAAAVVTPMLLKKLEAELKADAVVDSQEASARAREAVATSGSSPGTALTRSRR